MRIKFDSTKDFEMYCEALQELTTTMPFMARTISDKVAVIEATDDLDTAIRQLDSAISLLGGGIEVAEYCKVDGLKRTMRTIQMCLVWCHIIYYSEEDD